MEGKTSFWMSNDPLCRYLATMRENGKAKSKLMGQRPRMSLDSNVLYLPTVAALAGLWRAAQLRDHSHNVPAACNGPLISNL